MSAARRPEKKAERKPAEGRRRSPPGPERSSVTADSRKRIAIGAREAASGRKDTERRGTPSDLPRPRRR